MAVAELAFRDRPFRDRPSVLEAAQRLAATLAQGTVETCGNVAENLTGGAMTKWLTRDVDSTRLNGKVCLITGGNAGIGYATAELLAKQGAHVIIACRDKKRAQAAVQALNGALAGAAASSSERVGPGASATGHVEAAELDLASFRSVRRFCSDFRSRGLPLHLLVANAGIMSPPVRQETEDKNELQLQVNWLSHWMLAHDLVAHRSARLRSLKSPMPSSDGSTDTAAFGLPEHGMRVVMLSSLVHLSGPLAMHDPQSRSAYSPFTSYGLSKLANIACANELQRRFQRNGTKLRGDFSAVSVHPGVVNTHLARNFFKEQGSAALKLATLVESVVDGVVGRISMRPVDMAARTVAYAALAPTSRVGGRYLVPPALQVAPDKAAKCPEQGRCLWNYASTLTGTKTDACLA